MWTVHPRSQKSSPAAPVAVCAAVSPAQSSAEQEGRTRIVEACCSENGPEAGCAHIQVTFKSTLDESALESAGLRSAHSSTSSFSFSFSSSPPGVRGPSQAAFTSRRLTLNKTLRSGSRDQIAKTGPTAGK